LLVDGEHFGEISLLYGCCAQATVVALGYNNIASLSKRGFIDICDKFPQFTEVVKKCNYKYKDKRKLFMMKLIKSVEYF
jgi:hypothetical protein